MPSPAIASIIMHRFRWKEISQTYGLSPRKLNIKTLICSTVLFFTLFFSAYLLLILVFGNLLHVPSIGNISLSINAIRDQIALTYGPAMAQSAKLPPVLLLFFISFIGAITAGFSLNGLFALGEELGWRGFLWGQLRPYGTMGKIFVGVIWGLWHAPLILLGYNFPHHPYWGILFMIFFTVLLTFPLIDLRDKAHSVYASSIVHGMINASSLLSIIVIGSNELVGSLVGLVGCVAILCAWILANYGYGNVANN